MKSIVGLVLLVLSIFSLLVIIFKNNQSTTPYSQYTLLNSSWDKYKSKYITPDGRVIDFSRNNITTSEGQSYAMLQAVWIDDRKTFDTVWQWTQSNLKRSDNLFGWKWGQRPDNTYGLLGEDGKNSATDADQDIALALILASRRWSNQDYAKQAQPIIQSIWKYETTTIDNKRYLLAGNWANEQNQIIVNPSYFAPYAWRIFATVDNAHDWNSLINPSYELLNLSSIQTLNSDQSVGLPPDWIAIDKNNFQIKPTNIDGFTTNYSFDAIRIPWRIAVDYLWFNDPQAKEYLQRNFTFLNNQYSTYERLKGSYSHNGTALIEQEVPAMYATSLGYFKLVHPELAQKIFNEKIIGLYSNDTNTFNNQLNYYDLNWLWFGAALMNNRIISFT